MYKWDLFVPCARIFPIQTSDTGTALQQVHKCVCGDENLRASRATHLLLNETRST